MKATKNGKTKHATKETKHGKKQERTDVSSSDYSKTTTGILSLAKKYGAKAEQTVPGVLRIRMQGVPLLKLTGITKEEPTIYIRPKLRGEGFKEITGLQPENWKRAGSKFLHTGNASDAPMRIGIFLKRATKEIA